MVFVIISLFLLTVIVCQREDTFYHAHLDILFKNVCNFSNTAVWIFFCVGLCNMFQSMQLLSDFHGIFILLGDLIWNIKEATYNFVSNIVKFQVNIQKFFILM